MHQANRDTRLRMACIDHADLVGARRAEWRGAGRRSKPRAERKRESERERSPPSSPARPFDHPVVFLFPVGRESADVPAERDRARRREQKRGAVSAGTRAYTRKRARARALAYM